MFEGSGAAKQPSNVGRGEANPQGSAEVEPTLGGQARQSQPLDVRRGRASPRGSDEAEPMALVVGRGEASPRTSGEEEPALGDRTRRSPWPWWSDEAEPSKRCGRIFDRSDESTLMVISSFSLGTLVLVLDNSP